MSSFNRRNLSGFTARSKAEVAEALKEVGGPLGALVASGAAFAALLVTYVLAWAVGALRFLVGWNLGVVGVLAACGVKVGTVRYSTAFGASAALGSIKRILRSVGRFQGVSASGSAK